MSVARSTSRLTGEVGASSVEYAILASMIGIVIIAAVALFGGNLSGSFQRSCESVAATHSGSC